jgi:hypothetical protein
MKGLLKTPRSRLEVGQSKEYKIFSFILYSKFNFHFETCSSCLTKRLLKEEGPHFLLLSTIDEQLHNSSVINV